MEFLAGVAVDPAASGKVDLLSAVSHEIGHALGFDHDDGDDVMAETLGLGIRHLPIAPTESVVSNPVILGVTDSLAGANGLNEKTTIDWDGGNFELATPLGWNNGWTKRNASANFPEFVYAEFDNQEGEPGVFGSKKKQLGENAEQITFEPQGQIDWRIEI